MNAYADIFADDTDYAPKARAIARRQVLGPTLPKRQSDAEADMLAKMREAEEASQATENPARSKPDEPRAQRLRTSDIEDRITAAIGAPKTAAQIAAEIGVPNSTVKTNLRKMAIAGAIEAFAQPRHKSGQNRPFLYASVGTFAKPHDFMEMKNGPVNASRRDAVLALLSKPMAAFEVAQTLGISKQKARYQIQCLAADGLILPAGRTDTFRAKGIQQWVRA